MNVKTELYLDQTKVWPADGRHILAQYDDDTIIVYQAFNPNVADYAMKHGQFGGPHYSFSRMSWIKPNFLWMMYRCGWASKENQERVLGLRVSRPFFDAILEQAIVSSFDPLHFADQAEWKRAIETSNVRLQWDPDHDPGGAKQARRAIQLGLRGDIQRALATTELREVVDMTPFVIEQSKAPLASLRTPRERPYWPASEAARRQIALDPAP
ncbi:MAG TPA: DUF4291 domain-containing protein [Verrucomicrobiae bacterium]|nr:DUF4291 domain-containing protein [Verrucomicrobiae bacterium]